MDPVRTSRRLGRLLAVAAAMTLSASAVAQSDYPSKSIRIVVPFAAGGAVDVIARVVAHDLSEDLGQRVLVDNRPGGGAIIGTGVVAIAPPDGYTLLMTANPHTVNPSLMAKLPFDPVNDFTPITRTGITPLFVVVQGTAPANSFQQLIDLLKANPGKYAYGSSGTAGPQHLAGEMFKAVTGTNILHIPYKGAAPAATALLAGEVQMAFASPANTMEHVKTGRLRVFAVTTAARSRFAPDIPTMAELGFRDIDISAWLGLFLPRGAPRPIIDRLNQAVAKSLARQSTRDKLALQGIEAMSETPEQFAEFVRADIERSARIVRDAGIKLE
jgi:tripartite-type tricarboxylate transporter receptor subunit TctC